MKKRTKRPSKKRKMQTVIYDNAQERLERTAASETMNWATRRRAVAAIVVLGLAIALGFIVKAYNDKNKESQSGIIGLNIEKQSPCYKDDDCPDSAYCGEAGYCLPHEMQPELESRSVLGRGRGGEGANVYLSSADRRGQQ